MPSPVAIAGLVVFAPADSNETGSVASDAPATAPGTASLRAYLNPETGEIEAGPVVGAEVELDPDTQNALRRDTEGLVEVHHADGSVSIDVQGRFQNVSLARVNSDGTVTICSDNAHGVQQMVDGKNVVPTTPEVK